MTPAECHRYIDGVRQIRLDDADMALSAAWHTAAFSRVKRLRPFATYRRSGAPADPAPPPSRERRRQVKSVADRWLEKLQGGG